MTLRKRAERDEVTGMPGRSAAPRGALNDRLASGKPFALACIDFDGLKAVNDLNWETKRETSSSARSPRRSVSSCAPESSSAGCTGVAATSSSACSTRSSKRHSTAARACSRPRSTGRRYHRTWASSDLGVSIGAALANSSMNGTTPTPAGALLHYGRERDAPAQTRAPPLAGPRQARPLIFAYVSQLAKGDNSRPNIRRGKSAHLQPLHPQRRTATNRQARRQAGGVSRLNRRV